jgi:Family of unknown function (DUF6084)
MSTLAFEILDIAPEAYAVTPLLSARVAVTETSGETVHAMVLRAQVRIEPQRRAYSDGEADGMLDLFGPRSRWSDTLRPYMWLQASTVVPGFTDRTEVGLSLPCTYDFDVSAAKYLSALDDGLVPVNFQFSGTVFVRGESGFSVHQVPWDAEASYQLPVSVWRAVMDTHFPGAGWVRLNRDSFRAFHQYRVDHGLLSADEAVDALLDHAVEPSAP